MLAPAERRALNAIDANLCVVCCSAAQRVQDPEHAQVSSPLKCPGRSSEFPDAQLAKLAARWEGRIVVAGAHGECGLH